MRIQFEKVPLAGQDPFAIREFKLPAFDSPLHIHPELELTYIVQGRGKRIVGDSISNYQAGDLALIGANLPHCWHTETTPDDPWSHSVVIQINPTFLQSDFFRLPDLNGIQRMLARAARGLSIEPALRDEMGQRMKELVDLKGTRRILALLSILDLLAGSDVHEVLASPHFQPYPDNSDCERINRVCQYVFERFSDEVSLEAAASLIHMSKPAFCFYFKKRTRRSFSQFVNEIRVGHACKLLLETDRSVSDICFASGFRNLSNFNRRFRESRRSSPLAYRQQFGAG